MKAGPQLIAVPLSMGELTLLLELNTPSGYVIRLNQAAHVNLLLAVLKALPYSDTAIAILERRLAIKQVLEKKVCVESGYKTFVFVYKGKGVKQTSTKAWYKAIKASGLKNFRRHDLRHTWASWHTQGGTPDRVLKELGAWSTMQMVHRYAHLNAEHLVPWVRSHT